MSSLRVTYRAAADRAVNLQKYLDDAISQMMAGRTGYGQYRICFAGGYLDDGSRLVYEIYDDAGNTLSRISKMDDFADSKVLKELGGVGHPDDVGDILSAAKGLDDVGAPRVPDGSGEGWKVNNYGRVNEGDLERGFITPSNHRFDTTRINIANGPTRFSLSNNAGLQHVIDRHFSLGKNAGQFTISIDELKSILKRKDIINAQGIFSEITGQYTRVVNVGKVVGTIKPSIPNVGGKSTSWITIITDIKGNLIITYPCPAP